jgi:hypothetical protein
MLLFLKINLFLRAKSSSRGKANEDSYFFENLILSENMFIPQSSRLFAPKENVPDNVSEPTPFMSEDVTKSGATNQNSNNESFEHKDNQELSQMSLHEHPYNETERKFGEGEGTWKGIIYGRRNHDKGVEDLILQHSHESKPRENQPTKTDKGNILPDFYDPILDVPIAHRKPVRACTKHPMSRFVSYSNLSSSFSASTSHLSCIEIPMNIQEALNVPK